ncbi:MAG: FlgD immunoglobulin-like domain containing protein [Candidatus Krumholzibacteriia bacterium]
MQAPSRKSLVLGILGLALLVCATGRAAAEGWRSGFALPGFDNEVKAAAVFQGDLYVGGYFSRVGAMDAMRLARWDGSAWTAVPIGGTGAVVNDLLVHGGSLIVAGDFALQAADGQWCYSVARWDGAAWHAMGAGFNSDFVSTLGIGPAGQLLAGGQFWYSGATVIRNVAYWSGSEWLPFASGVSGAVYAVGTYDGQIVIGGHFTNDNLGNSLSGIARWTGAAWRGLSAPAAAANGAVHSLQVHDGSLYAGGAFTSIEGSEIAGLASWNGAAWSAVPCPAGVCVTMLGSTPGRLIAGGYYKSGYAAWDNIDDGSANRFTDLAAFGDGWVLVGAFGTIGDVASPRLASWDGTQLTRFAGLPAGNGLDYAITALLEYEGELVAGGKFNIAGAAAALRLAAWNGTSWREFGGGVSGDVTALATLGTDLVVAGSFLMAGDVPINRIARWDGAQWQALGSGFSTPPKALVQYGADLIAAGSFSSAGGVSAAGIARWDGTEWHALGSGLNLWADALTVHDGLLVVGGYFTTAGGLPARCLAAWDGTSWSEFAGGADQEVLTFAHLGDELVAGGYFSEVGGVTATGVARLRAGQWEPLGAGFVVQHCYYDPDGWWCDPLPVNGLWSSGSRLYASGAFSYAGSVLVEGLACWDEVNQWQPMDGGVQGSVYAMGSFDGALVLGGTFSSGGGVPASMVALYDAPADPLTSVPATSAPALRLEAAWPNPFNPSITVRFRLARAGQAAVTVHDLRGRLVRTLAGARFEAGEHVLVWDGQDAQGRLVGSGGYFLKVRAAGEAAVRKVTLLK